MVTSPSDFVAMKVIKGTVVARAISKFLHILFQAIYNNETAMLILDNCKLDKTALMRRVKATFDMTSMLIISRHSFFSPIE